MTTDLQSRVARFGQNEENVDAWAKGDETTSVDFGGGPVRSPTKLIYEKEQEINAAADGLLRQSTENAAIASEGAAVVLAITNRRPSISAAINDPTLVNALYFSTPSTDPKVAAILYRKLGATAVEETRVRSADGVSQDLIDMATAIVRIATVVVDGNAST